MSTNDVTAVPTASANVTRIPEAKVNTPAAPKVDPLKAIEANDTVKASSLNELASNQQHYKQAVNEINTALKKIPTTLHFQVDESSKRFVVNVTDLSTGDLIRSLPGEAVLRIARQLESLKGIIFDDKF
tara:strand:+ start:721 stop:1107 length:387 start_codon:yes stop_codon:yes gene_type:complete